MKPIELEISGWGPYKQIQKINFEKLGERGIFLVTGPTGAGKTTIFDAISFALYGNLSGQIREKNSVRSDFADKDTKTYVNLKMQHKGLVYQIYRNPEYMRPKKRKSGPEAYTKERENAILTMPDGTCMEGAQEVTKKMQEILSLDYRQFKQISMIAQGEFAKLLTEAPAEKIKIFRELFGTSLLEQFAANLRAKASGLYKEVMEYRHRMDEDVNLLHEDTAEWEELIQNPNYEAILDYLERMQKEYKNQKKELDKEYEAQEQEERQLAVKVAECTKANETIEKLEQKEEQLKSLKEEETLYKEKEQQVTRMRKAQLVEPDYIRLKNSREQLTKQKEELEAVGREKERLRGCIEKDAPFFEKRTEIAAWIDRQEEIEVYTEEERKNSIELEKKQKELGILQEEYTLAEGKARAGREKLEQAEEQYRRSAIGIAVKMLKPGKPCPVCGATEHPAPAQTGETLTDEKQLKELRKQYEILNAEMFQVHEKAIQVQAQKNALETEAEHIKEKLDEVVKEEKKNKESIISGEWEGLSTKQKRARLEEKVTGYQKNQTLLQEKTEAEARVASELTQVSQELTRLEKVFKEAILQQDMCDERTFLEYIGDKGKLEKLTAECRQYQEQIVSLTDMVNHLREEVKAYGNSVTEGQTGIEKMDIEVWKQQLSVCSERKAEKADKRTAVAGKIAEMQKVHRLLKEKKEKQERISEEYGIVKDLDNLASGNNTRRLVFEQYVLSAYFEQVLAAANVRFEKMTAGRYEMFRSEEVLDGRSKDSLEICVMDYYTGKSRPVKTLSGGETFKASLALALGLSDVVGRTNGGIRVETLFIDEGFGALDSESLDQACEALTSLVETEKLIGIISHVPELRERIDNQLVIHKTNSGSRIENVLG